MSYISSDEDLIGEDDVIDFHDDNDEDEDENFRNQFLSSVAPHDSSSSSAMTDKKKRWLKIGAVIALCLVLIGGLVAAFVIPGDTRSSHDDNNNSDEGDKDHANAQNDLDAQWERIMRQEDLDSLASDVLSSMNKDVDPCDDFYEYACGGWIQANRELMPADRSSWSKSFSGVDSRNREVLKQILNDDWPMLGTFWRNCLDMESRNALGETPLATFVDSIQALVSAEDLFRQVGELHAAGFPALFSFYVEPDMDEPLRYLANFDQGGFQLPAPEYYASGSGAQMDELQRQYQLHMQRTLALLNMNEPAFGADGDAAGIAYGVEASLASAALSRTARKDPNAISHKGTLLAMTMPSGDEQRRAEVAPLWRAYLEGLGAGDAIDVSATLVNVAEPAFFEHMIDLVTAEPSMRKMRAYLLWMISSSTASLLSQPFLDEQFRYTSMIYGAAQPPSLDDRCLAAANSVLGMLLGRYYVAQEFSADSKVMASDLVRRLELAFQQSLRTNTWIATDATRQTAIGKIDAITNHIGYPDTWPDRSAFFVQPGDFFGNVVESHRLDSAKEVLRVGCAVDRAAEFDMNPQLVNAYYNPLSNSIVFPSGILQRPFFVPGAPAAYNFGSIGAVIAHEITHSSDDEGRRFDALGRLNEAAWDPASIAAFNGRAQCVIELFDTYEPFGSADTSGVGGAPLRVNGNLTLGENIADLGIKFAHAAYRTLADVSNQHNALVHNTFKMSNDQLFFTSFAQTWCTIYKDEYLRFLVNTNPHSPAQYRVRGAVSQTPAFADAFKCPVGSPMNPSSKCSVW
jgi:putative endopeptidase